jgi:EpsI family protein
MKSQASNRSITVLAALMLILAWIAYRPLFELASPEIEQEIEGLLFDSTSTGPLVVMVIAIWLVYRRWNRLRRLPRRASYGIGLALLLPSVPIYAWAVYTGATDLLIPALMLNLLGFGALIWGAPALKILFLPAAFLLFAMKLPVPLLNELLWKLQIWTADLSGFLLTQLGMLNSVAGDQIMRPGQKFAIIETCAGLRSAESLTMLAMLMVDLFRRPGLHGLILVATAPVLAFGVNGIRALTLILNPHSEIVAIHNLQGIVMLLIGLFAVYLFDGLLERVLPRRAAPAVAAPSAHSNSTPSSTPGLITGSAVLVVLVGLSVMLPRWQMPPRGSLPYPDSQIPKEFDGWTSNRFDTDLRFLGIVRFRARVDRLYQRQGEGVRLFLGVGSSDRRAMSPFSPKTAYPGSGWWVEEQRHVRLEPDGRDVRASVVRFGKGTQRRLVFDWNEGTRGRGDEVLRFVIALDQSRWERPREGVAARISTDLKGRRQPAQAAAEARLRDFYAAIRPEMDQVGYPRGQGN